MTQGIPDPSVLKEIIEGYGQTVIPMTVVHRYLVTSGLIDQTIGFEDYMALLAEDRKRKLAEKAEMDKLNSENNPEGELDENGNKKKVVKEETVPVSKINAKEEGGLEDKLT